MICNWLWTLCVLTFLWVLVTLVTDWNTVFYRKAIIYRKRLEEESRRHAQSSFFTESISVAQSGGGLKAGADYFDPLAGQHDVGEMNLKLKMQSEWQLNNEKQFDDPDRQMRSNSFVKFAEFYDLLQN